MVSQLLWTGNKQPKPWLVLAVITLVVSGCSESGPPLGIVSGTVTLDGQPLEGAAVVFTPNAQAADAGSSQGKTGKDGRYSLSFGSRRSGAYLSEHNVIIEHQQYFGANHAATVEEGQNSIDFTLTSNKRNRPQDGADNAEDIPATN
jgi:hypothetical protein